MGPAIAAPEGTKPPERPDRGGGPAGVAPGAEEGAGAASGSALSAPRCAPLSARGSQPIAQTSASDRAVKMVRRIAVQALEMAERGGQGQRPPVESAAVRRQADAPAR
jgi:hypothetical protein